MQVPAALAVAVSIDPEPAAGTVLHPEVVARHARRGTAPPFRLDALRPLRPHHAIIGAPPAETRRRSIVIPPVVTINATVVAPHSVIFAVSAWSTHLERFWR